VYISEKGGVLTDVLTGHAAIDATYSVRAGKFRRYKVDGWRQAFNVPMQLLNVRDAIRLLIGIWQSYWLIRKLHPGVIFTRGGYVSVPVALGGKLNGVPFVTHDSDSTIGLANRIIGRWAAVHAVGMDPTLYPYPKGSSVLVGVPASSEYERVTTKLQHSYRHDLGLRPDGKLLFVTGGGNGASSLNQLVAHSAQKLLTRYPDLTIIHASGRSLETALNQLYDKLLDSGLRRRVLVKGFVLDMYRYTGAADVVIARAGASTLAELAIQGKACVVIPASHLTWQVHQARTLAEHQAIMYLPESKAAVPNRLEEVVSDLLDDASKRAELGNAMHSLAIPDAALRLAVLLLDQLR